MYAQNEDGCVRFRVSRRNYIINKTLWDSLKAAYDSFLTFEVKEDQSYQVYLKNKKQPVEEEIDVSDSDEANQSVIDYLPTERDSIYPLRQSRPHISGEPPAPGMGARMNTGQLSPHGKRPSVLEKILLLRARLAEGRTVSAIASDDVHLIMNEKERTEPKHRSPLDHKSTTTEEYASQPSCEIPPDNVAPPVGMRNYGVTCYLNASLQCLLCIPEMNTYFLGEHFAKILHQTREPDFAVCCIMARLYKEIFAEPVPHFVAPKELVKLCPSGQQDAHEFIWKRVFPRIQDETNPAIKKPKHGKNTVKSAWGWYQKYNNSIFDKLFAGIYESTVRCKSCENLSVTYDPFLDISLPVAKKTLESSLKMHFRDELFSKADSYKCDKCNTEVPAIKCLKIAKAPRYLILHLKRLVGGQKKISTFIQYPSVLNIKE